MTQCTAVKSKKNTATKTKNKKLKKFAFWSYDQFPYLLGGTVTNIIHKKCHKIVKDKEVGYDGIVVATKEYGHTMLFYPIMIMPEKEGKKLLTILKNIKELYSTKIKQIENESESFRNCIVKPYMKKYKVKGNK